MPVFMISIYPQHKNLRHEGKFLIWSMSAQIMEKGICNIYPVKTKKKDTGFEAVEMYILQDKRHPIYNRVLRENILKLRIRYAMQSAPVASSTRLLSSAMTSRNG